MPNFTVQSKKPRHKLHQRNTSNKQIISKNDFPYHFKEIIVHYKKIGYNIDVLRQTACLVVNPIKVNSFAYLFNCTMVGRASH